MTPVYLHFTYIFNCCISLATSRVSLKPLQGKSPSTPLTSQSNATPVVHHVTHVYGDAE